MADGLGTRKAVTRSERGVLGLVLEGEGASEQVVVVVVETAGGDGDGHDYMGVTMQGLHCEGQARVLIVAPGVFAIGAGALSRILPLVAMREPR